jgi:hypothetical protein
MNNFQFARVYQCLPMRCSGLLISLHNEHSVEANVCKFAWVALLSKRRKITVNLCKHAVLRCPSLCVCVYIICTGWHKSTHGVKMNSPYCITVLSLLYLIFIYVYMSVHFNVNTACFTCLTWLPSGLIHCWRHKNVQANCFVKLWVVINSCEGVLYGSVQIV